MHNPFAGETPFPIAGEGVVLKFRSSDIARLHSVYGPDTRKPPEVDPLTKLPVQTFWTTILGHLSVHDPNVVETVLRVGLKERDDDGKLKPIKRDNDWWEDLPFSFADGADQLSEALFWSRWGMTSVQYSELLREQAERDRLAALEGAVESDPTLANGTGNPTSFDSSSEHTSTA
jgi:hypothetical protein